MSNPQPSELPSLFSRNNVAVITGAASGIGRAAAQRCGEHSGILTLSGAAGDDGQRPA